MDKYIYNEKYGLWYEQPGSNSFEVYLGYA